MDFKYLNGALMSPRSEEVEDVASDRLDTDPATWIMVYMAG